MGQLMHDRRLPFGGAQIRADHRHGSDDVEPFAGPDQVKPRPRGQRIGAQIDRQAIEPGPRREVHLKITLAARDQPRRQAAPLENIIERGDEGPDERLVLGGRLDERDPRRGGPSNHQRIRAARRRPEKHLLDETPLRIQSQNRAIGLVQREGSRGDSRDRHDRVQAHTPFGDPAESGMKRAEHDADFAYCTRRVNSRPPSCQPKFLSDIPGVRRLIPPPTTTLKRYRFWRAHAPRLVRASEMCTPLGREATLPPGASSKRGANGDFSQL